MMPDDRSTNSSSDMIVASTDIRDQRTKGIEGSFIAIKEFARHILRDEVHRDMPWAFDHHLHIVASCDAVEFAKGL